MRKVSPPHKCLSIEYFGNISCFTGGLRNVYKLKEHTSNNSVMIAVAKESRHEIKYQERVGFHLETAKSQLRAFQFAKAFNQDIMEEFEDGEEDEIDIPEIKVLCTGK